MKNALIFLAFLLPFFGCHRTESDSLEPQIIEQNYAIWNYSQIYSLIRYGGSPTYRDIYIKIDGSDGSHLFLSLPQTFLDSIPPMPYEITGRASYYAVAGSQYNLPFEGPATIQLLAIDPATKELQISFSAVVSNVGQTVEEKHFESGVISDIEFKEVNAFASTINAEIKEGQVVWPISEIDASMVYGQVNWFYYIHDSIQDASAIYLTIPWGQPVGALQLQPGYPNLIHYEKGGRIWDLISAQIILDENNFTEAKQKGRFSCIFRNPTLLTEKFEVTDAPFEVSFKE